MISTLAIIAVFIAVYLFILDAGSPQIITSRFNSFYKPFRAETIVQHEYSVQPETIWQTLMRLDNYSLWFPGLNSVLPVSDRSRYVHRFSFEHFKVEPGAFIKTRSKSFLPWLKGRILGMEPNKKLELEIRFNPVNTERVVFEINRTPRGTSEVICQRTSQGLFSFLTTWRFADKGSSILHNLSFFLLEESEEKENDRPPDSQVAAPQLSKETIIGQAVQAGLDGNTDLINAIQDKATRGMAKAALVKAKRTGKMADHLLEALKKVSVSLDDSRAETSPSRLPVFENNDDLIAYVVNLALDGNMDPINSIPDKPLRGKAKSAMVKAKRTGGRPDMPKKIPNTSQAPSSPVAGKNESEKEMIARLVEAGLKGNMDEINRVENKVLRGKIKSAIVRAKRAAK